MSPCGHRAYVFLFRGATWSRTRERPDRLRQERSQSAGPHTPRCTPVPLSRSLARSRRRHSLGWTLALLAAGWLLPPLLLLLPPLESQDSRACTGLGVINRPRPRTDRSQETCRYAHALREKPLPAAPALARHRDPPRSSEPGRARGYCVPDPMQTPEQWRSRELAAWSGPVGRPGRNFAGSLMRASGPAGHRNPVSFPRNRIMASPFQARRVWTTPRSSRARMQKC
uniref:Uncharacterized protein n=1 Tax=Oryza brachyantha TaxID=4533 RepID=J3L2I5_ORYBR